MKKLKSSIKVIITTIVIVFICFSFILWELNPMKWEIAERLAAIMIVVPISVSLVAMIIAEN